MEITVNRPYTFNFVVNDLKALRKLGEANEYDMTKINVSSLARKLNKSRNTIRKYYNGFEKKTGRNKSSAFDEYYPLLLRKLYYNSCISYKRHLYEYLKEMTDVEASENAFYKFINKNKVLNSYFKTDRRELDLSLLTDTDKAIINDSFSVNYVYRENKFKKSTKHVIMHEVDFGEQMEIDWKENQKITTKDGQKLTINILSVLCTRSRYRLYLFSFNKNQNTLFSLLDEAFEFFGGVPKYLKTDNMKTVMDKSKTPYQKGQINKRFEEFLKDYGIKHRCCNAFSPEEKSRVENSMKVLDKLLVYDSYDKFDLNAYLNKLGEINNKANNSLNKNLGDFPSIVFKKEKEFLLPLPCKEIRTRYQKKIFTRICDQNGIVNFSNRRLILPIRFANSEVEVHQIENQLYVYYNKNIIEVYELEENKMIYSRLYHHMERIKARYGYPDEKIREMAIDNMKNLESIHGKYY